MIKKYINTIVLNSMMESIILVQLYPSQIGMYNWINIGLNSGIINTGNCLTLRILKFTINVYIFKFA